MLNNGFHHLYVIVRLRPANSGIDMDPKLIGLSWTSSAKVTLLVPEASKSQMLYFTTPVPAFPPALCLQGGVGCLITIPRPPPLLLSTSRIGIKQRSLLYRRGEPQEGGCHEGRGVAERNQHHSILYYIIVFCIILDWYYYIVYYVALCYIILCYIVV